VAAVRLGERGRGEKLPPGVDAGRVVIVLEDKEGWGE